MHLCLIRVTYNSTTALSTFNRQFVSTRSYSLASCSSGVLSFVVIARYFGARRNPRAVYRDALIALNYIFASIEITSPFSLTVAPGIIHTGAATCNFALVIRANVCIQLLAGCTVDSSPVTNLTRLAFARVPLADPARRRSSSNHAITLAWRESS